MKKFKVNFTTKMGRKTHRIFRAPNLSEAQAQFNAVQHYADNCEWTECPYIDVVYKNAETGEVVSDDLLYAEYLKEFPDRNTSFIGFCARRNYDYNQPSNT